ncbi:MAG: hypothetical protein IPM39_19685 [Chloroflexi bacterium]|nr:hypothetical protein [Chloroflexota bacterium]
MSDWANLAAHVARVYACLARHAGETEEPPSPAGLVASHQIIAASTPSSSASWPAAKRRAGCEPEFEH